MREPQHSHLAIDDRTLDDLLAALRRHDLGEATRLIERWAGEDVPIGEDEYVEEGGAFEDWVEFERCLDHPLTAWAHREIASHVADGRFEHALCLVEQYRRPMTEADMQARLQSPPPTLFDRSL